MVSGTLTKGVISSNDTLYLGPDFAGKFEKVVIKGIHRKRMPVKCAKAGQTASFALKKVILEIILMRALLIFQSNFQIKRSNIRKGMVMLHLSLNPKSVWEYRGEILVLHHPTTISAKYQAMGLSHVGFDKLST